MTERVMVIAAHPDDEVLGCGGTAALHARAGHAVTMVIVCDTEHLRVRPEGARQGEQIRAAARELGIADVVHLKLAGRELDRIGVPEVIARLEEVIRARRPTVVYTQHGGDIHRDHRIVFDAVQVAIRPVDPSIREVLAFDTASSTEWGYPQTFAPDTYVDISDTLDRKIAAMACYVSEVREYPHPRSLRGIEHRARGWGNRVCVDAAEAFVTIRRVLRGGRTVV